MGGIDIKGSFTPYTQTKCIYTFFYLADICDFTEHTLSTRADVQESRGKTDAPGGTEPQVVWVQGVVQEHLRGHSIPHQINALQGH